MNMNPKYIYPEVLTAIGTLASALDEVSQAADDFGFVIGAVPIISTQTGEQIATIAFDNDQHAVVEI